MPLIIIFNNGIIFLKFRYKETLIYIIGPVAGTEMTTGISQAILPVYTKQLSRQLTLMSS